MGVHFTVSVRAFFAAGVVFPLSLLIAGECDNCTFTMSEPDIWSDGFEISLLVSTEYQSTAVDMTVLNDPAVVRPLEVSDSFDELVGGEPEATDIITADFAEDSVRVSMVLDPPRDRRFPAGDQVEFWTIFYGYQSAFNSTTLTFADSGGAPPITNYLEIDGSLRPCCTEAHAITPRLPTPFLRGDANESGAVTPADAAYLCEYLAGNNTPSCLSACDANGDDAIDTSDPLYLLDYFWRLEPAPPPPFPEVLWPPREDTLGCATYDPQAVAVPGTFSLSLGEVTGPNVTLPITMTASQDVQGFVLSLSPDPDKFMITNLRLADSLLHGGGDSGSFSACWPSLGFVSYCEGLVNGATIPAGNDILIAEVEVEATAFPPCGQTERVEVAFNVNPCANGLENSIIVDQRDVTTSTGLSLLNGSIDIPGQCETLHIVPATAEPGFSEVDVRIELENQRPIEGYTLAVTHEAGVELDSITLEGTSAVNVPAEFVESHIYPEGGTLSVVFEMGRTLPGGARLRLAVFRYGYDRFDCEGDLTVDSRTFELNFADQILGSPPVSNRLLQGGIETLAHMIDGSVTFLCGLHPPHFLIGALNQDQEVVCAYHSEPGRIKATLFYTSGEPIQGLSAALRYPPGLRVLDVGDDGRGVVSDRHLESTETDNINAAFRYFNASNERGELVIGLVAEGGPDLTRIYPPTPPESPKALLHVFFELPESGDQRREYPLTFFDGVLGAGDVPIYNRAAISNQSRPVVTRDGCLTVNAPFKRGDANDDGTINLADAIALLTFLFQGRPLTCLRACDCNGDGILNIADPICLLAYLFGNGEPPAEPFEECGHPDEPTDLTCEIFTNCGGE
ncbi:dockerin type I repeat-containing protein [Candidatus Fermentibacteria bacterium]|nr:dockerin type I repeat-containing protein [Candidatus Fermentibacteria bacterium]